MPDFITLPLAGFLIGLLVISLGGGGGAVYVGVLTVFFNVPPAIAASTSLATVVPTTAMGAISHWKAGNVNVKLGLIMLISGVVGALIGTGFSGLLPEGLYNKVTGCIMLALAVQMVVQFLQKRSGKQETKAQSSTLGGVAYGLLGGVMSGLVGLSGGGAITAGLMLLGCSAVESIGTSVFALFGISLAGFLGHLGLGIMDWRLAGLLIIGTVSGALVGPVLLKRVDKNLLQKVLQPIILVMILGMGITMLFK